MPVAEVGHNSNAQLRSFAERIENLNEEIATIQEDRREVFREAKSAGFNVKMLRAAIKLKGTDKATRDADAELLEAYCLALGLE